tara:strand:+ start:171 stop:797 length:627 start_codon:yes stop_codon:yes gene_type:complete
MENIEEDKDDDSLLHEELDEAKENDEIEILEDLVSEDSDDEILSDLETITLERDELKDKLMRSLAENENIRKRSEKEKREAESYGITKMSRDILSVYDNLQRALDLADDILDEKSIPMIEGLELTKKDLLETFKRNKIEKIEPLVGEKFDPKLHQAMFEGPSDTIEKGTVMQVLSIGFSISDRLLRAAHVAVSSGKTEKKPDSTLEEK